MLSCRQQGSGAGKGPVRAMTQAAWAAQQLEEPMHLAAGGQARADLSHVLTPSLGEASAIRCTAAS